MSLLYIFMFSLHASLVEGQVMRHKLQQYDGLYSCDSQVFKSLMTPSLLFAVFFFFSCFNFFYGNWQECCPFIK
uniref:Uncharacterized protein n=1 Tax=Arundo donax TaxID=35708 RepID=A0A0A9D1Q2_ARUDO